MISRPILGQMTQGVIFAGAFADQYVGVPVWGLCITARCDAAHDKAPVFNYLPIVRFEDWVEVDGRRLLCETLRADAYNTAQNRLKNRNLSASVLDSYPPTQVAQQFFPIASSRPDRDAILFHQIAERIERIDQVARAARCPMAELTKLAAEGSKSTQRVLHDLIRGSIGGYYFLDTVGETDYPSERGYVVLMREVHHVSSMVIRQMAGGISKAQWQAEAHQALHKVPNFDIFDFALPTGRIVSPKIEHLMQAFALLFIRIGIEDPDPSSVTKLHGIFSNG